ncbi:nucleotidyltransferase domain-containing protein [Chitinophaga agrisoli]|uniref:Nucleotidyltransferase domain-containing protein n=1 Tax=Chitinophaga agrisoli TaxID=2607653 RepID=A0A5B2VTR2_9BACT|nr:nucleotidyltransferase domain-containing protein [Chitinophaga agrisoli]KAA2243173.1 nucleotidyltransferase domain-containing protein [Chitinophaga agrisoli]
MHPYLSDRLPAIREACLQHRVKTLYVFGSVIDGRFRPGESDIDMWIQLKRMGKVEQARTLMQVWLLLQQILSCEVDLLPKNSIRGVHFKRYLELYQVKIFDSGA